MYFEIIGEIEEIESIAIGGRIRDIMRIRQQYGPGRWRKLKGVAMVRLQSGRICKAEVHWYEADGIGRKKLRSKEYWVKIMKKEKKELEFALCIENKDCEDLEKRKIYQVLPDDEAVKEGYLRVIDESGEDYLYPQSYFILVQLSQEAQEALRIAS